VIFQLHLDRSNGFADVTATQAPRPERNEAVLTKRRKKEEPATSCGTRISTTMSHCILDVEFVLSKGATSIDCGSHAVVVRNGGLVDGDNVLSAIGRP